MPELKEDLTWLAKRIVRLVRGYDHLKDGWIESQKAYHNAMNMMNSRTHVGKWVDCTEESCVASRVLMDRIYDLFVKEQ